MVAIELKEWFISVNIMPEREDSLEVSYPL